jgi:hypothetical protein
MMNTGAIFFEALDDEIKAKAYELVAYELLEAWLDSYQDEGDLVTDRFIEALGREKGTEGIVFNYELAKKIGEGN